MSKGWNFCILNFSYCQFEFQNVLFLSYFIVIYEKFVFHILCFLNFWVVASFLLGTIISIFDFFKSEHYVHYK
jgi:hypothetical protein